MNAIKDTWRQLVRRRLWPVAVLLLGALVAVPMVLASSPEPVAPAPTPHTDPDDTAASYVALAETGDPTTRRRVLGASKDPFEPKALPKVKKAKKVSAKSDGTTSGDSAKPESSPAPTASSGGSSAPAAPPAGTQPPAVPVATVPAYSIKVRFGTTETDELPTKTVQRLSVLPDEEHPVLVYRGVEDGGKAAIFELTGDIVAQGDGTCRPTPEDCQYLKLRAGETEFITVSDTGEVTDAQYQLDLVKIYKKATKVKAVDDAAAARSLAKASSGSLKGQGVELRRRNRYVFDPRTGVLHRAKPGQRTPASAL